MSKSKITKNLREIDLTNQSNGWKVFSTPENFETMQKMGVMVTPDSKTLTLKDKMILEDSHGELHIMKKNTFCPHEEKLDISSAVNEKVWDIAINALSVNDAFKELRNYFLPVNLNVIKTASSKGGKCNEKVCSSTVYLKDYNDRGILQAFYPEIFEKLDTKTIPSELRIFSTLIGKKIKASDVLFNEEGKVIAVDNADANPFKIPELIKGKQFFEHIDSLPKEEAIQHYNTAKDMALELLGNVDNIIEDTYAIYNKINLERNPSEKNRVSGLRLYEHIWNQIPSVIDAKISQLKGEEVEIPAINTIAPQPAPVQKAVKVKNNIVEKDAEPTTTTKKKKDVLKLKPIAKPLKNKEVLELIEEEESVVNTIPPSFESEIFEEELIDI